MNFLLRPNSVHGNVRLTNLETGQASLPPPDCKTWQRRPVAPRTPTLAFTVMGYVLRYHGFRITIKPQPLDGPSSGRPSSAACPTHGCHRYTPRACLGWWWWWCVNMRVVCACVCAQVLHKCAAVLNTALSVVPPGPRRGTGWAAGRVG